MDPKRELEQERGRRMTLEEELAGWHIKALERVTPQELAMTVHAQQVESLTYHLLKSRQSIDELTLNLAKKDDEIRQALKNIDYLEGELESKTRMLEDMIEAQKKSKEEMLREIEMTEELPDSFNSVAKSPVSDGRHMQVGATERSPKTIKDFIHLMRQIGRIKLLDVSILLETNDAIISRWAKQMSERGYVKIQGSEDNAVLVASKKLLNSE